MLLGFMVLVSIFTFLSFPSCFVNGFQSISPRLLNRNKSNVIKFVAVSLAKENTDQYDVNTNLSHKIARTMSIAIVALTLGSTISPLATWSAVGEGDLPDGVIAFSKVIKFKNDWKQVIETIKSRQSDLTDVEVQNIKIFLKQLANEYGDMDLLSRSITDQDKAVKARTIAKDFRKQIRACDDAISEKQFNKVIEVYPATEKQLTEYLDLLSDVPDEI
eukprot:gene14936-20092_t